jgi:hypothetical protein
MIVADEIGLSSGMSQSVAQQMHSEIVELVLATDMARHFEIVASFRTAATAMIKASAETARSHEHPAVVFRKHFSDEKYETRMLLLKIAIKLSDLGHCCLRWTEHMTWCKRLELEFFAQGDVEQEASMHISPLMDRRKPGVCHHPNCVGFFRTFLIPMLEVWVYLFPLSAPCLKQAQANLDQHRRLIRTSLDGRLYSLMEKSDDDETPEDPSFSSQSCRHFNSKLYW